MRVLAAIASAASGMRAAKLRLEASTGNVASMRSSGVLPSSSTASARAPQAYQPVRIEQTSARGSGGGAVATVRVSAPAWRPAYAPDPGFADTNGMVAEPNVDLMGEALEQATAEANFLANLQVFEAAQAMVRSLYELAD
jgi:flagellar basal-body rod protein FlgC